MDWKQILSLSNENMTDERKEEIYTELIKNQKFDSKIAKKLFPLCLAVLKYKGQQVEKQREEIEMLASTDIDLKSTLEQMEKQKKMLSKYELERAQYKTRIKELSDEIAMMHGRELQGSDEDSPDQLSEIDKQQELMAKISAKNKHIRRLLRDIEKFEQQVTSQHNVIKDLEAEIEGEHEKINALCEHIQESKANTQFLEEKIAQLQSQLLEQEAENHQLAKERENREKEIEEFSQQVEERIQLYKSNMEEKQRELDAVTEKYEKLIDQVPGIDIESEHSEVKRCMDLIFKRDSLIKTYEEKVQQLSSELMDATQLINKMQKERDEYMSKVAKDKADRCCEDVQSMLEKSNARCQELQEMLHMTEEDNFLKSKQAYEAIETLRSYENSSDVLADSLKKIYQLQESVHERDKQIRELVAELNTQNEILAENAILRRRLDIPEDEIVETKAFLAKQKRYTKINDRLMLKLRASEELRLQLKLDKNDLRRRISELEAQLNGEMTLASSNSYASSVSEHEPAKTKHRKDDDKRVEMKQCESCNNSYNVYESLKYCRTCIMKLNSNLCENCTSSLKATSSENIEMVKKIAKMEIENQSIVEENENLRCGLNEILAKLRDYEGASERMIINPATLEKLIYILNLRNAKSAADVPSQQSAIIESDTKAHEETHGNDSDEVTQLKLLIKELSDENESIKRDLEKMETIQRLYDEMVRSAELSDDDKDRLIMQSVQRCHEFEENIEKFNRKIEFLQSENDNLHQEVRLLKISTVELSNDTKMEIFSKLNELHATEGNDPQEEALNLQKELQEARLELNGLCFNILKNIRSLDAENALKSIDTQRLSNVAVIEDNNFTTSFITRQELQSINAKLATMQEKIAAHESRERYFEELAKVAQYQLKSQQLMLSQFSDDEIAARHLIVDLQSHSNENYLLTRTARDLKAARDNEDRIKLENEKLRGEVAGLQETLREHQKALDDKCRELSERENNNLLKIQYLKKSLLDFCHQYSTLTPIYHISDFIKQYAALLEERKQFDMEALKMRSLSAPEMNVDSIMLQLKDMPVTDIEAKIEIIKHKSSCDYLKQQLEMHETTIKELHNEIARIKLNEIKNRQHWNAIEMLFGENTNNDVSNAVQEKDEKIFVDKEVQVEPIKCDGWTNTDEMPLATSTPEESMNAQESSLSIQQPQSDKSLEVQLKKALILASSRSALLIEAENSLSEAQGRIKVLEKNFENHQKQQQQQQQPSQSTEDLLRKDDHILSSTITTLQSLILEKDKTLSQYQELLKSERQHYTRTYDEMSNEIRDLKKTINANEATIDEARSMIEKLNSQIVELVRQLEAQPTPTIDTPNEHDIEMKNLEIKLKEAQNETKKMEQQLKDLTNIECQLQKLVREKDATIRDLNIKLKASNDNFETLSENFTSTTEIDQLREMLEEKDKHIQDLTETLNQFHDDQQKYINDTALNSAEQVHIISADLTRTEATNRVLKTQLESLKRQVTNIQQREKQARDTIKTLNNQLIKRPVISVKSDKRPASKSEEKLQKRVSELENELLETKDELRRQTNINDNKKAKNAAELGLWDKQKRFQEMSEKLKGKLTEKEIDCERMKANLQIAKNSIARLEREKTMLENKIKSGRYLQNVTTANQLTCQHCRNQKHETPTVGSDYGSEINHELIAALKSRIESQQRRIVALEFEGKGTNAFTTEMEKLQEEMSSIQARNIRLEAKNIQLQLDYDMLKQNDCGDRQEARIKHLEDYILVLKEELAQAHATYGSEKSMKYDHTSSHVHAMEQTILKLKRVVEKLQVENKHLKNSKHVSSHPSTASYMSQNDKKKEEVFEKLKIDHEKLQKSYNEMLGKISALQIELELSQAQTINVSCPHCNRKNLDEIATQDFEVVTQQLQQKTALLEKAKTLLQRAAAKEKQLLERIYYLKKRVCDLEGVPVISEENSESG